MKFLINTFIYTALVFVGMMNLQSCLRGEFDEPGILQEPQISADQIIPLQEVLDKMVTGQNIKLDLDKYVKAVVIADDKSGNFYKTIVVRDEDGTHGVSISIEETEIHAHYPVGRRVFIHLKDLYIGDVNNLPTLNFGSYINEGSSEMAGIPGTIMQKILLKGQTGLPVEPVKININQLGNAALNTLIQLDDVEFRDANASTTYADPNPLNPLTINHVIVDCSQNQITLRNSGYADFAGAKVPLNNGSMVGIYTIYNSTKQIFIRDTNDVNFTLKRCGERGGEQISIRSIRDIFASGSTALPAGSFIKGVVISDFSTSNIQNQNVVIQDGDAGIVCRFSSAPNVALGTEVRVNLTGQSMSLFNGLLQVSTIPNNNLVIIGPGTLPTPKVVKISDISQDIHESTLVKILDAEFIGGNTYGTSGVSIKDNSGSMQVFTRTQATFANQVVKAGKVNVTAIVGFFNALQLQLRSLSDVE